MASNTLKKSYRQIGAFDREARGFIARRQQKFIEQWRRENPDSKAEPPSAPHNKFVHAVNRMLGRSQAVLSRYNEEIQDLSIKYASEDKDGNLAMDERGNFKFTKEQLLARNKKQRELFDSATQIEPYYATEIPKDLADEDREIFVDFVIRDGAEPPEKSPKTKSR